MTFIEIPLYLDTEDGCAAAALVTMPDADVRGALLVASAGASPRHGRNGHWRRVGHELAALGVATMRVDYPGIGLSAGVYEEAKAHNAPAPMLHVLRPAYDALRKLTPGAPTFLTGECFGARASLALAATVDEPVAALLIDPLLFPKERVRQGAAPSAPPRRRARRGPVWLLELGKVVMRPVRALQRWRRRSAAGGDTDRDAVEALVKATSRSRITVVRSTGEPTAEYWARLSLPPNVAACIELVDVAERIHNLATVLAQERCRRLVREWIEKELAR